MPSNLYLTGEGAVWRSCLNVWFVIGQFRVQTHQRLRPVVSLRKKRYPYCIAMVGSTNRFIARLT